MSHAEKPLHVQVAEALGFDTNPELHDWDEARDGQKGCTRCLAHAPWEGDKDPTFCCPPYGADTPEGWACTGPLLQRFGMSLEHMTGADALPDGSPWWGVVARDGKCYTAGADTACEAIAVCVVDLAKIGKLP